MTTIQKFLATQGVTSANGSSKVSTDAAIMAVPYGLDPIRLVGDEEKHATILHFGETSTLPSDAKDILLDILVQVAKNSSPFRERIISVSRLGSDNPPALVAMLSNRFLEQIRNSLQVSPQVRDYVGNMQQFPQFIPHVTLGYPDYQGETELRQMVNPLGHIQFDRLSLWWNGEHFDVPLMDTMSVSENCDSAEAGWGEDVVSDFLAHYGVKGMKWKDVKAHPELAVQNAGNSNAPANASFHNSILRPKPGQVAHDPKAPKGDVDWAKKKATAANLSKVANKSHNEFQNQFRDLLKSPRFQEVAALIKARKNDPASAQNPKVIAFFKQAKKIHDDIWAKNSEETFGRSPSNGYKLIALRHPDGTVTSQMVKTTAPQKTLSKSKKTIPTSIRHDEALENFLMHFGIKGMRWGIRRERGPGGTVESGVKLHEDNSFEIPSLHKMPVGSVAAIHTGESAPKLMKKRSDGRWEETHLSADAERFAKTRAKAQHELSDREINEATKRAEAIKKYNDLFGENPNKELADKVAAMQLQVNYAKLHSELHPSFGTKVGRFVKNNEKLFSSAVGALSGPTGKKLVDYLKAELSPGIQAVANQSTTTHPKQSTTKGTSVAKQTATLPFSGNHGNGPGSNPSHTPSVPKRSRNPFKKKPKVVSPMSMAAQKAAGLNNATNSFGSYPNAGP